MLDNPMNFYFNVFLLILFALLATHLLMTMDELNKIGDFSKLMKYKIEQTDFLIERIENTFAYNFTSGAADRNA